ncbi:hypothetical protein P7K49_032838 [Saguinus oedipus]|uniref:AP-3 complex subunit delta domain-containing protein n=1 Tax=Saguinus oedipus TaxID=9490 RepID=A0ABQ9TQM3_SAGOE|nr:hypothetical protein P7K49_032838 [Saguinus oedipus]
MSDQYVKLEEERRHQQKLEKDKRKKKRKEKEKKGKRRHGSLPTESDEDIAPAQQVDIVTEEMPENALPSDEDDKDPNDPYRALDIDLDKVRPPQTLPWQPQQAALGRSFSGHGWGQGREEQVLRCVAWDVLGMRLDSPRTQQTWGVAGVPRPSLSRPLADSEKLPIQKHRNAETSKSPEKEDVPVAEKKSKKPKKKEKKHREKGRDKEKKKEKEKKVRPAPRAAPFSVPLPRPELTDRLGTVGRSGEMAVSLRQRVPASSLCGLVECGSGVRGELAVCLCRGPRTRGPDGPHMFSGPGALSTLRSEGGYEPSDHWNGAYPCTDLSLAAFWQRQPEPVGPAEDVTISSWIARLCKAQLV